MDCLIVLYLDDCCSHLKPLWPLALSLAHLPYLVVNSHTSWEARSEGLHARRTSDVMINDNWRPSSIMRQVKRKHWTSLHLFNVKDMKQLLAWVFDCNRKSFEHFLLVYQILSFERKHLCPSFPEYRDGIPFKGAVYHILKFSFWNVNHFFHKTFKISKRFHLF
jgi:hypothetical protein